MRIAHVTDLHIREERLAEQLDTLRSIAKAIDVQEPHLITVGGDLCGVQVPHRATPAERNALCSFLRELQGTAPVVVLRGNHDLAKDYEFLNYFGESPWPLLFASECELLAVQHPALGEEPMQVMCLPWIDRSAFPLEADYAGSVQAAYRSAVSKEFAATLRAAAAAKRSVLLAHVAISGALLKEGQPSVPTSDPVLRLPDVADHELYNVALFGHYHAPQRLTSKDKACAALYGGSLFVNEYGESIERGWTLFDTDSGQSQFHRSGCAPRLTVTIDCAARTVLSVQPQDWPGAERLGKTRPAELTKASHYEACALRGSHVKLVCQLPEGDATAMALVDTLRTVLRSAGALSLHIERHVERVERLRAGAASVAAAGTLADKVRAFLDSGSSASEVVSPEVRDAAMDLLAQLEAELDGGDE